MFDYFLRLESLYGITKVSIRNPYRDFSLSLFFSRKR
eukprot:UN15737